jgi:hypothetical protein
MPAKAEKHDCFTSASVRGGRKQDVADAERALDRAALAHQPRFDCLARRGHGTAAQNTSARGTWKRRRPNSALPCISIAKGAFRQGREKASMMSRVPAPAGNYGAMGQMRDAGSRPPRRVAPQQTGSWPNDHLAIARGGEAEGRLEHCSTSLVSSGGASAGGGQALSIRAFGRRSARHPPPKGIPPEARRSPRAGH